MVNTHKSHRCQAYLLVSITFVLLLATGPGNLHGQEARRPNVLVILTDDQGSVDVNCYGAKDLTTPHLDRLARQGVRFTQFYSAAPVCSPSRAGLLTGRYPQRAQLSGNASSRPGVEGMPSKQITMAEVFRHAGYATGHVGKWHLGYTPQTKPRGQGFDTTFGHMGGCIDNYSHFFYWNGPNRHDLWHNGKEVWAPGQYFPDLMVDHCREFLTRNKEKPFFLYWAINVPHYPLQATDKWREHYAHLKEPRAMYAAFVSTMDERIGEVLDMLDELELADNTIVVYQSDHGHSTEVRTFGGGGNSGPYRGAKFSLFEGGIRVPAMIRYPGKLPAGKVRGQVAMAVDWLPTLTQLCGIPEPEHRIDGLSLVPVIQSADADSPHKVLHWQSGRGIGGKPQWAVRRGDWKLIGHPNDTSNNGTPKPGENDQLFLINLAEDIGESTNLAKKYPARTAELTTLHDQWLVDVEKQ